MAHKKGAGSTDNGRDSAPQYLGVKKFGGEHVLAGNIIVTQKGTKFHAGLNTYLGKTHTLHAKIEGIVGFKKVAEGKRVAFVLPMPAGSTTTTLKISPEDQAAIDAKKAAAKAAAAERAAKAAAVLEAAKLEAEQAAAKKTAEKAAKQAAGQAAAKEKANAKAKNEAEHTPAATLATAEVKTHEVVTAEPTHEEVSHVTFDAEPTTTNHAVESASVTHEVVAKPTVTETHEVAHPVVSTDDLKKIEGIGPKIAELLHQAGIHTFAQLSETSADHVKEILHAAGPRYQMHNPETWGAQAALAAAGKWDELKKWQDEMDGGRA